MTATLIPEPKRPHGPLASPVAAADLGGISVEEVRALIRAGSARSERIEGEVFVDLDDVTRAAARNASGDVGVRSRPGRSPGR